MLDAEKEAKESQRFTGKSYTDLNLERMFKERRKVKLDDEERGDVGLTARSQTNPSATVTGREKMDYSEEQLEAMGKTLGAKLAEVLKRNGPNIDASAKEFDHILSQVFGKPHGGADQFVNLRSPGMGEAKISASPGQSGSQTGRRGSGTSTYPNDETGSMQYTGGYSYDNPTSVRHGGGATTGPAQQGSAQSGIYPGGADSFVAQNPTTKPGQLYDTSAKVTPVDIQDYDLANGGKISKSESFKETISRAFSKSGAHIPELGKGFNMASAQAPQTGGNVQTEQIPTTGGFIPTDEGTATRFDEEANEEKKKFEEAALRNDNTEAAKHFQLMSLALQRARETRKRLQAR